MTPRVKLSAIEAETIENSPILEGELAIKFRSGTIRCAYLAQDFVDISGAVKYLALAMVKPKAGHMTQLKRVARYLGGVPRKALQYTAPDPSRAHMEVHADSGWAGDTITRRSTSGSDCAGRTTFAQERLNSTKRDWSQKCRMGGVLRTQEERSVRTGSAKACLPTGT